jgi:hypothetical protein
MVKAIIAKKAIVFFIIITYPLYFKPIILFLPMPPREGVHEEKED